MTAPWLARRSKTDELEALVALLAVGLHFVVATVLGCLAVYRVRQVVPCYLVACGVSGPGDVVSAFLILDVLLFLVGWGLSFVLASKGWWRVAPPLAGAFITAVIAAIVLTWWSASTW